MKLSLCTHMTLKGPTMVGNLNITIVTKHGKTENIMMDLGDYQIMRKKKKFLMFGVFGLSLTFILNKKSRNYIITCSRLNGLSLIDQSKMENGNVTNIVIQRIITFTRIAPFAKNKYTLE